MRAPTVVDQKRRSKGTVSDKLLHGVGGGATHCSDHAIRDDPPQEWTSLQAPGECKRAPQARRARGTGARSKQTCIKVAARYQQVGSNSDNDGDNEHQVGNSPLLVAKWREQMAPSVRREPLQPGLSGRIGGKTKQVGSYESESANGDCRARILAELCHQGSNGRKDQATSSQRRAKRERASSVEAQTT